MKKFIPLLFFMAVFINGYAQPSTADTNIPIGRQYFHDRINETQQKILDADYINDSLFTPYKNDEANALVTHAATAGIDSLQNLIEISKLNENNGKVKYLGGLNECLINFIDGYYHKETPASALPEFVKAFAEAMDSDSHKQSIESLIANYPYTVGSLLVNSVSFFDNEGLANAKNHILQKLCFEHPEKILITLSRNPGLPNEDSLIYLAARLYPEDIYSYSAASDELAIRIHNNPDSLVQIIAKMASTTSGRQYFPFLDNIYHNRTTFAQIDDALKDSTKYFSLLVSTAIDYADRLRKKDTPIAQCQEALYNKISVKAKQIYVYRINSLHDQPDNIRFRIIDKLTPQELYYAAVSTEDEIYTSSYVRGIYPRIWKQMKNPRSDSLLMNVRFDHFKKWVKMTANYNLLSDFLNKMTKPNGEVLMKAFVNGLDQTNSLEDAVDVADSYAAIDSNKEVKKLILNQVQYNLSIAKETGNKKAVGIYNILNTMFLSLDSANKINMAEVLGIPPVYYMPNAAMHDSAMPIVIQQFFYGDKDGMGIFNAFINSYRGSSNWKTEATDKWVLISSTKGTPVRIYSNRALDENQGLDEDAQHALDDYLYENNLEPTMVIHRGHSYYLPSTLDQLATSAKVILLGSCGAYQHLNKVLQSCPAAQIISSRQTGSGSVNIPMINTIIEELRQGHDLNWPLLWKKFSSSLNKNEYFDDYVPPHKNLGAVLIMAYNKMKETNGLE